MSLDGFSNSLRIHRPEHVLQFLQSRSYNPTANLPLDDDFADDGKKMHIRVSRCRDIEVRLNLCTSRCRDGESFLPVARS